MSEGGKGIFDPFGTYATKGYLENVTGEKDLEKIKRMEHLAFTSKLGVALTLLEAADQIDYPLVLRVHQTLFGDVYPWAGKDRLATAPGKEISKGAKGSPFRAEFERPEGIQRAFDCGLSMAATAPRMREKAGAIMGFFAFAHPFLDGNGRTILLVHMELCFRAGFSIAWGATRKDAYLKALSLELDDPRAGHLDSYLRDFVIPAAGRDQWLDQVLSIRGLDGTAPMDAMDEGVYVAGNSGDPEMQERYDAQAAKLRYQTDP